MGFLVALFAIAASVWMIPVVRRGRVATMVAIILVLGTVVGPFFFAINGPIQFSLDRIAWVSLIGYIAFQWRLGRVQWPTLHRVDWVMIALAAFLMVSTQQGGQPPGDASPFARWLFYIWMPLGTYAMVRTTRLRAGDLTTFMSVWLGLGIYLAVTAVLEIKSLQHLVFPRYINDPKVWEFYGRGRGPLLNPIANGVLIGGALIVACLRLWDAARSQKPFYAIAVGILLTGIYATLTRSCWVGAIGAIGLIAMLYAPRWVRVWSLGGLVILAGAMSLGLKDQLLSFKRDKNLSAVEAAKSIELRPLLAVVAWEMFKDAPIVGHGFGHYFEHNDPYHNHRGYDLPLEKVRQYVQHNTMLSILVDGGMVGISLFLGVLAMFAVAAMRIIRQNSYPREAVHLALVMVGLLTIYFANAMFHDLIVIPMVQMFLMATAGLTVNAATRGIVRPVPPATSSQDRRPRMIDPQSSPSGIALG